MIELVFWERGDLCRHLPVDLPSSREALEQLKNRSRQGATAFADPDDTPLHNQVLRVWTEHFAWDAFEHTGVEMVIGEVDEESFVDLMAEFLWENRHTLTELVDDEESA